MKKRILVTGANGYIGNALIQDLLAKRPEYTVCGAARRGRILKTDALQTFQVGSLEDHPDYSKALRGCDTVVHCAMLVSPRKDSGWIDQSAYYRANVLGLSHLVRQASLSGVKRFICLSSVHANGEVTPPGKKFFADSAERPKLAFGLSMLNAERELRKICQELNMEYTIIRVPTVYGPECKGFCGVIKTMVRYCIPLPLGWAKDNRHSLIAIQNLTDFLITCIEKKEAANELFLVADNEELSTVDIFRLFAKTSNRPYCLWGFPPILLKLFNSYIGRQAWEDFFLDSLVVDISKNKLILGWTPPLGTEEAFRLAWGHRLVLGEDIK